MGYPFIGFPPAEGGAFDEDQWIKQLFILSDMASYLGEAEQQLFYRLPLKNKKQLLRKRYRLSASAAAHILEKHYYKIPRYPMAGKFTLPVAEIFSLLRDAFSTCATLRRTSAQTPTPIPGSGYLQRITDTGRHIGFDRSGQNTSIFTVITDAGGRIITAFPGLPAKAYTARKQETCKVASEGGAE